MRLACGEVPASRHITPVLYRPVPYRTAPGVSKRCTSSNGRNCFWHRKNAVIFGDKCESWLHTTTSQQLWRETS